MKEKAVKAPIKEMGTDINEFNKPVKGVSLGQDAWKRLRKNKMAVISLGIVVVYILMAVTAPILPIYSYRKVIANHQDLPPSLTKTAGELWYEKTEDYMKLVAEKEGRELNSEDFLKLEQIKYQTENDTMEWRGKIVNPHERLYLLGTDYLGRDMLARIIYGSQVSMLIGLIGTVVSFLIGTIIGSMAGYLGGKTDYFVMRVVDVMYGLPYMLMVIILMAIVGRSVINLFIALALVSWLTVARVVRGQVISLKNSEFIEAARSMGASTPRIVFRHLVPNSLGIIIVYATLRVPAFIMMESFLSFLGMGISAPYASWGTLVKEGVDAMTLYSWRLIFPAAAMTLFLFAMNFLGDGLRDAFDPQSKNK